MGHLPIIDLSPELTWADPGATVGSPPGTPLSGVVSGSPNLSGSITIPIVGGLSASYDRIQGNFLNTTFAAVNIGGKPFELGSLRRRMEVERLDYGIGKTGIGLEVGSQFNRFECCLPLEFHDVYAAISYSTPGIPQLGGTHFVLIEKGSTAAHKNLSGSTLDVGKREYGLTQIVVAVVPVSSKFYATGTYFNGAYDFFETQPFPFSFNLFNETANFVLNPNATFSLGFTNTWQHEQGAPFPAPGNAIHFVSYYTQLKLHFDLNKLLAPK